MSHDSPMIKKQEYKMNRSITFIEYSMTIGQSQCFVKSNEPQINRINQKPHKLLNAKITDAE